MSGPLLHAFVQDVMKEVRVADDGTHALPLDAWHRQRARAAKLPKAGADAIVVDLLLAARNATDVLDVKAAPLLMQLASLAAEVLVEVVGVRRDDVDAELDARAREAFGSKESLIPVGARGAVAGAVSPFSLRLARAKGER